jgi:hypothetical protein
MYFFHLMNTVKPFVLTRRIEEILQTILFYRYMTLADLTRLPYLPSSESYMRKILSALSGGRDFQTNQYLYRFQMPHTRVGNTEKIYTLGSRGRDYLMRVCGLSVDWYFRPNQIKHLSYSQIIHNLTLTRFIVAATAWAAKQPDFNLIETRICYEIAKTGTKVVPDAWLLFEKLTSGVHENYLPVLLEIDRGMEYQRKFKQHVSQRIEFIKSGAYSKLFGHEAVIIAYVTTGGLAEYGKRRRRVMCDWTRELLTENRREKWASVFRFAAIVPEKLYSSPIFDEPVWYRPDSNVSISLFTP